MAAISTTDTRALEHRLLLEAVFLRYGYDFRGYARASLARRIRRFMAQEAVASVGEVQHRVLHDPAFFQRLLLALTVNVTEMFRDPEVFVAARELVVPALAPRTQLKVWHAGCATGEEVYSVAILLEEAGLLDRCRIFATDINGAVLETARAGIYPLESMRAWTANYQLAGGKRSFSDYYTARYDSAIVDAALRRRVVFADHNLTTDAEFGEMDLIVCRNVLIYFGREIQNRAMGLFVRSLTDAGMLWLGPRETVRFSDEGTRFEEMAPGTRLYRLRAGVSG